MSARELLASMQQELQRKVRNAVVTWTPEESWHITTHYLGEVSDQQIDRLIDGMELLPNKPVRFSFWNLSYYPKEQPRVIVLNLADPTGDAFLLRDAQFPMVLREGLHTDTRPWQAHITLGRIRSTTRAFTAEVPDLHIPAYTFTAPSLSLFESHDGGDISYHPIATLDLPSV